jgi:pilus assembly protein CpaE
MTHVANEVTATLSTQTRIADMTGSVVAFVSDNETAKALTTGLSVLGRDLELRRGDIETCIRTYQTAKAPATLIVDLGNAEDPFGALDRLAAICPPDTKVFVIGTDNDIGFYRTLTRDIGVAEYVAKPLSRDLVRHLILPKLDDSCGVSAEQARGGRVITVCGARGGVGTSSIAVNLAYELTETTKGHVALVDLHINNGEIALMLGCKPGPGLRNALEGENRIDALLLERIGIELEPRLHLFASQEPWDIQANIAEGNLTALLHILRQRFNYVIVDMPMPPPAALRPVLLASRQIVTVLTPDVASVRDVNNIRELVKEIGGGDRMLTVLNRANMKGGLARDLLERALGAEADVAIPDLGGAMLEAINKGVPAVRCVSSLRKHLRPLLREITGKDATPVRGQADASRTGWALPPIGRWLFGTGTAQTATA